MKRRPKARKVAHTPGASQASQASVPNGGAGEPPREEIALPDCRWHASGRCRKRTIGKFVDKSVLSKSDDAQSDAPAIDLPPADTRLEAVIKAWPGLPEATKAAILALVEKGLLSK